MLKVQGMFQIGLCTVIERSDVCQLGDKRGNLGNKPEPRGQRAGVRGHDFRESKAG